MTDELGGDSITRFGSAGPKSYCYATKSGDKECKNKGIQSPDKINQNLNCDSMINHFKLELSKPQEARRTTKIEINNYFVRDSTTKSVKLEDVELINYYITLTASLSPDKTKESAVCYFFSSRAYALVSRGSRLCCSRA